MPFPNNFPADHYKNPKKVAYNDSGDGEFVLSRLINQQPGIFAQDSGSSENNDSSEKRAIILNGFVPSKDTYYLEQLLDNDFKVYQVNDEGELQSIKDVHNLAINPKKASTEQLNQLLAKEKLKPEESLVLEQRHVDLYYEVSLDEQKNLSLTDCSISASELSKMLAAKPELEFLFLRGVTIVDDLNNSEIFRLNLPKLKKFVVSGKSSIFPFQINAPALEFISIQQSQYFQPESSNYLKAIQANNFENLHILQLDGCIIDSSVLASLCSQSLSLLDLNRSVISGEFSLNEELPNLKRLVVPNTKKANTALLLKSPNIIFSGSLREQDLDGCLVHVETNKGTSLPYLRRRRIMGHHDRVFISDDVDSLQTSGMALSADNIDKILPFFKNPEVRFDVTFLKKPQNNSEISYKKLTKHSTPKLILKNMTEDEIWKYIDACPAPANIELENIDFTQQGRTLAQPHPGKKIKLRFEKNKLCILDGESFLSWKDLEMDWETVGYGAAGVWLISPPSGVCAIGKNPDSDLVVIGSGELPAALLNITLKINCRYIKLLLNNCSLTGELNLNPSNKFSYLNISENTNLSGKNFEELLKGVDLSTSMKFEKINVTTAISPGLKVPCGIFETDAASWYKEWCTLVAPEELIFSAETTFLEAIEPLPSLTTLRLEVPFSLGSLQTISFGFPNLKKLTTTTAFSSSHPTQDELTFNEVEHLTLVIDAPQITMINSTLACFPKLEFFEVDYAPKDKNSKPYLEISFEGLKNLLKFMPLDSKIVIPDNAKIVFPGEKYPTRRAIVGIIRKSLLPHFQKPVSVPAPKKEPELQRPNPANPQNFDPNKTQTMLIDRLNAYAKFVPPDYESPEIQKGICSSVAKFYADTVSTKGTSAWKRKWDRFQKWNRQSLPAEGQPLRQNLGELADYVARYQTPNIFYRIWDYFFNPKIIVNDLNLFLAKPFTHPVMISNGWHRTSLLVKDGKWHFYDPNYADGEAKIFDNKEELIKEIHSVLGHGLSMISYDENLDEVWSQDQNTVNHFLADGGFQELLQNNSRLEGLKPDQLSQKALEGLFLTTLNHNPFWAYGLIEYWYTPFTAGNRQPTTLACMARYQKLVGQAAFEHKIKENLSYVNIETRKQIISSLPNSGPYKNLAATLLACLKKTPQFIAKDNQIIWSKKEDVKPIDVKPQDPMPSKSDEVKAAPVLKENPPLKPQKSLNRHEIDPPKQKPETLPKASQFLTWTKQKPETYPNLEAFDDTILNEKGKNLLVRFKNDQNLRHYIHHLQASPKAQKRGLCVINHFSDLQCAISSLFVDEQGKGHLQETTSYFYNFIKRNKNNSPIILVNWANFSSEEVVQSLNLIAKKRAVNGHSLPKKALVLGLQNPEAADAYLERDFSQSFAAIKDFPTNIQIPKTEPLPLKLAAETAEVVVEFYNDNNWESFFYGQLEMGPEGMVFKPSALLKALKAKPEGLKIVFRNAPWHLPEFNYAWSSFLSTGALHKYGLSFDLPPKVVLENQKGYDFKPLISKSQLSVCEGNLNDNEAYVLNPDQLSTFFMQYRVDKSTHTMQTLPGLIAAHPKQKPMQITLTRAISLAAFARLLNEAAEHKVVLQLKLVGKVKLPKEIAALVKVQKDESPAAPGKLQLVVSNDLFCTEKSLKFDKVVDISDSDKTDLLYRISGKIENTNLRFDKLTAEVWKDLKNGKRVLLKGSFSKELVDALAGLFTAKGGIYRNGKFKHPEGELILLTDNPENFAFAPMIHHRTETFETRAAFLKETDKQRLLAKYPKEALENCPLAHLQLLSRKPQLPAKLGSLTKPLYRLPKHSEKVDEDYDLSKEKAERFERSRVETLFEGLNQCPVLFLSGKTGVGKSSFMHELKKYGIEVYFDDIEGWLKAPAGVLFIDEANLEAEDRALFTTLLSNPKSINYKGKIYPLNEGHKLVLAGNPANYGQRHVPNLLLNFPNVVTFGAMNNAYLYHRIIKPIVKDEAIARIFLKSYQKIKAKKDEAISARELQMMAYVFRSQTLPLDPMERAKNSVMNICKNLLEGTDAADFQAWFKAEFGENASTYPTPPKNIGKMRLVPSHGEAYWRLKTMIAIRDIKRQENSFGGLSSLVFEGDPKSGKTSLVKQFLIEEGFRETKLDLELLKPVKYSKLKEQISQKSGQNYYYLPADLSVTEKSNLLFRAFHEGAIVVMKDSNSVKRLLNALRMGEDLQGRRALVAGFTLIETQSPLSQGRAKAGLDSERRSWKCKLPAPNREEMLAILAHKGCSSEESLRLVDELMVCQEYAQTNNLTPAPNFGDLMVEARKVRLAGNPNTFYAEGKRVESVGDNEVSFLSSMS